MYRALYIYNIEELRASLEQSVTRLFEKHPEVSLLFSPDDLVVAWIRHHLIRLCYIHLQPDPLDNILSSAIHNDYLIAEVKLTHGFYRLIAFSPHIWRDDRCLVKVTNRELTLEFVVTPAHYCQILGRPDHGSYLPHP